MSIIVTITKKRHLEAAMAVYLSTIPADPEVTPPYASVEDYVQAQVESVHESWADTTGVDAIPVGAFVRRFPGARMDAINAAAPTDPVIAQILAQLDAVKIVRLGAQVTIDAMTYLVAHGYITQSEFDAILAY